MAFLGIKIQPDISRMFRHIEVPGDKVSESEYHITILCFEDNCSIKLLGKTMEAAYDVISKTSPIHIKTNKISCFPKREDNPVPIIAKVKSNELTELNSELRKTFDKSKIKYMNNFDFKPHMTLSYAEEEIKDITIEQVEFVVHELVIWGGDHSDDKVFITFPLKAPEKKSSCRLKELTKLSKTG